MEQQRTDLSMLTDAALAEAAWQHRREALHGNRKAFGLAHEFERELRRRTGVSTPDAAPQVVAPRAGSPWWHRWRRSKSVQPQRVTR